MILQSKRVVVVRQRYGDSPGDENRLQISDGYLCYLLICCGVCLRILCIIWYVCDSVCVEVKKKR